MDIRVGRLPTMSEVHKMVLLRNLMQLGSEFWSWA